MSRSQKLDWSLWWAGGYQKLGVLVGIRYVAGFAGAKTSQYGWLGYKPSPVQGKPQLPRKQKTFQYVGAGQAWANELDVGRGRTIRSIITSKGKWVTRAEGLGKGRLILGVAGKGRQGGWVGGGVQWGPRLWVGGGVKWEQRLLASRWTAAPHWAHWL